MPSPSAFVAPSPQQATHDLSARTSRSNSGSLATTASNDSQFDAGNGNNDGFDPLSYAFADPSAYDPSIFPASFQLPRFVTGATPNANGVFPTGPAVIDSSRYAL